MDGTVDRAVLDRVIRRVVQVAQPEKIILFGSAAKGRMGRTAISICLSSGVGPTPSTSWVRSI